MKWKVLKSKYIANDPPWFTTRVDTVQLPNGEVLENYYVLEYPDWVTVLALTEDEQFVFVEQYRHAYGKTSFELSAGVVDEEDESLEHGARRELLEETGYGGGNWTLFTETCANPGTHTNTCYTFLATGVTKIQEQELDRTEDISVRLFNKPEVLRMLEKDEIIQSMHSNALWKWMFENK
jgi:ADP-ribose pyrophosphatase